MSNLYRSGLAAYLTIVALHSGHAQLGGFYPITSDGVSLDNGDFALLIDAANGLLRRQHLVKGDNASWRSKRTGSHGTISVTKTFRHDSMLCHTLTYETNPMTSPSANIVKLDWCDTPEGWRILSS